MPAAAPPSARLLAEARAAAAAAVREAVAALRALRRGRRALRVRRKGEGDFVTDADRSIEMQLRRRLTKALPQAGFLGEEGRASGLDRELLWVVDPIDGTSNFARGLPHHAIAVALLHRSRPIVATCWCSPDGLLYEAVAGGGARCEGRRLSMPRGRWDDGAIVGCQWFRGQQDLRFLARLQRDGARVRTFGCSVAQLVDVACGRLDGNVQQQGMIWDLAAPGLLVEEAGGMITDWSGRPLFPFRSLEGHVPTVAAHPAVHRRLLRRIASP
jgi:myo-inositol-1(or 4)-monophosphatase